MQMHDVIKLACKYYSCDFNALNERSRRHEISHRRGLVMALIYAICPKASYPRIGAKFGYDHTAVLSICRTVWNEPKYISQMAHLAKYINQNAQVAV